MSRLMLAAVGFKVPKIVGSRVETGETTAFEASRGPGPSYCILSYNSYAPNVMLGSPSHSTFGSFELQCCHAVMLTC